MKRKPCEHCGKSHQDPARANECRIKHAKQECTCPPYWRRRDWKHSYAYGCPLAE